MRSMRRVIVCLTWALWALAAAAQPAGRIPFNEGWTFEKDGNARIVDLPHDWGVEGDFKQEYPGESGKLAWWGRAVYRKTLEITPEDLEKDIDIEIDGAMSHATVSVNGTDLGGWPYGYASFAVRLNPALKAGKNEIAVRIDNPEESSRWYPGGGIYRNVWITKTNKTAVAHWGTYITTDVRKITNIAKIETRPRMLWADAGITLRVTLKHAGEKTVGMVRTQILRQDRYRRDGQEVTVDRVVAETRSIEYIEDGKIVIQTFEVEDARLWSPEQPALYIARTTVETPDEVLDTYETTFGIRQAEWKPDGFYLNGEKTFLKGVCLHHDAGALGAVWNDDAWVRRLQMLKDMGCNAIRTSHNPPAPEFPAGAELDLSHLYDNLDQYVRQVHYDGTDLEIVDTIQAADTACTVRWAMCSEAAAAIFGDRILLLSYGKQRILSATVSGPAGGLTPHIWPTTFDPSIPDVDGMQYLHPTDVSNYGTSLVGYTFTLQPHQKVVLRVVLSTGT